MKEARLELITVLFLFVVVAIAGMLMRSLHWADFRPIHFQDLRNAHSHLAFLGWLFPVIMIMLERVYRTDVLTSWVDRLVFWGVILVNVLMFGSFLTYGYGSASVVLLSVHTILAVIYGVRFWNRLDLVESPVYPLLAKLSMATMMGSFLGPLAIWTCNKKVDKELSLTRPHFGFVKSIDIQKVSYSSRLNVFDGYCTKTQCIKRQTVATA